MKKLYPLVTFLLLASFIKAANRYWVATGVVKDWNVTANWSTTAGGAPGASVPGAGDVALFTVNSSTSCRLIANTSVGGIRLNTGFTGQFLLNGNNLIIGASDLSVTSGLFICGTGNLTMNGTVSITGGNFDAGSATVNFTQAYTQSDGLFTGNTASVDFTSSISITGGTFTSTSSTLFVNSSLTINNPGVFVHNNGTVEIKGNNNDNISLSGAVQSSLSLFKFIIQKPNNSNLLGITSGDTLIIQDSAIFINGSIDGGGVVAAKKDIWVQSGFDNCSNPIRMEGAGTSRLILDKTLCTSTGSSLTINKSANTDSVLFIKSAGVGNITEGQGNNAFTIARGIAVFPQNNRVQLNFNSLTLLANGTFIATQDSLFNAGAHNNNNAGLFKHNNGTYIFNGISNRIYDVPAAVPDTFYHVVINKPGGADNVDFASGDTMLIKQNLTIADGQLNGTGTIGGIKLEGNLESGTLMTATNLGLVFTGTANQTVNFMASTISNWNGNVKINKTNGTVILLSVFRLDAGTAQTLTFVKGNMVTGNTNILIIGGTTAVSGANSNSFTEGPVRKDGNQTFVFPIGKGGIYAPVRISNFASSSSSTQFRAEYFRANPHPAFDNNSKDITIASISACEYWFLDRLNTSATVKAGLSYEVSRSCGLTSFSTLKVCRWNGTKWADHLNDNIGPAGFVTSATNVTSFGPFTLGANFVILPVVLKDFSAKETAGKVYLNWFASTGNNSGKFEIQRSANGNDFTTIKTITPNTPAQLLSYSAIDDNPLEGKSYYRIKLTDENFAAKYTAVATVITSRIRANKFTIYPNPVVADVITIQLKTLARQKVTVQIINRAGQMVVSKQIVLNADGTSQIGQLNQLLPGLYFIRLYNNETLFKERLVIQ
jgi:hypothetical protein